MTRTAPKLAALAVALTLALPLAAAEPQPQATDLTQQFRDSGVSLDNLRVVDVGGIVIIRGRTGDKAQAEEAGRVAQRLGYARVANLVQVAPPVDDAQIARAAERELSIHRSLDGCKFSVKSQAGVVTVGGSVHHEMQKDVAMEVLKNVEGVRGVRTLLQRF